MKRGRHFIIDKLRIIQYTLIFSHDHTQLHFQPHLLTHQPSRNTSIMPWRHPPRVDFLKEPEYQWPSWFVGYSMDALFGELHQRFNTMPFFLLDRVSFHRDVFELCIASEDKADFEARLQKRRDERFEEMTRAFDNVVGRLVVSDEQLEDYSQASNIIDLSRDGSLDRLVQCLAGFLRPKDGEKQAPPGSDAVLLLRLVSLALTVLTSSPAPFSGARWPTSMRRTSHHR